MYQFTEDCLIGIDQIDEEHRRLFEIINEAIELLHNEMITDKYYQVSALLEELGNYAEIHFAHEEEYMERINDPELPIQKKQHTAFAEKISQLEWSNKDDEGVQQQMLEELLLYLTRWLYHHILSSDMMIGKMKEVKEAEDPFAFSDKYLTGISLVDEEHKTLFEIIGQANELIRAELLHDKFDEIVTILDRLHDYTVEHFNDEEAYMERMGYSRIDAQKRAHEAFVEKLEEIDLDEVDENQQQYLIQLMDFLLSWLINHIMKADKLIGEEAREKHLI